MNRRRYHLTPPRDTGGATQVAWRGYTVRLVGAARRQYEAIQAGGRAMSGEMGDLRGFLPLTGASYYPGGYSGLKRKSA